MSVKEYYRRAYDADKYEKNHSGIKWNSKKHNRKKDRRKNKIKVRDL